MAKTLMESLLCAEQHAKCCTGSPYLTPAIILKGTFYCSDVTDGELKLRKLGSAMHVCTVRVWLSHGLNPEASVVGSHFSSSSFHVCIIVNILSLSLFPSGNVPNPHSV